MIFCNISLPNLLVLEIEVDTKAKGQEVLDKVCERLDIVEVDYFGLRYTGSKGEQLWLNLRNRLNKEIGSLSPNQCRFQLRVKFFVQPHYLLQQTTRHVFYLHLKNNILTGECKFLDVPNENNESGRSTDVEEEFDLYLGHPDSDNTSTNSNISNTLSEVKNYLLLIELCALIAQAERGDYNCDNNDLAVIYYDTMIPSAKICDDSFISALKQAHSRLAGVSRAAAESRLLRRAASMPSYGVEYHNVKNADGHPYYLGVGPEGITVYDQQWQMTRSVPYPLIKMATHKGRFMFLHTYKADGCTNVLGVKLVSEHGANALYRAVTEMHSFYRCDTVRGAVSAQFSRDLKGTLASLFNEDTTLGKKFVFDIRRTCRETYEHARRTLYRAEQLAGKISSGATISALPSVTMPSVNLASASVPAGLDILSSRNSNLFTEDGRCKKKRLRRRHRSSNSDEGGGGKLLRKEELEYGSNSAGGVCYRNGGVWFGITSREKQKSTGVLSLVAEDVNSCTDDTEMPLDDRTLYQSDDTGSEDEESREEAMRRFRNEATKEAQMLRVKLERLEECLQCRVCLCNRVEAVFCPCGHAACCLECTAKMDTCPLCRSKVDRIQRIYLSAPDDSEKPATNSKNSPDTDKRFDDNSEQMDFIIFNSPSISNITTHEAMDDGLLVLNSTPNVVSSE